MKKTLNAIIDELKAISDAHLQVAGSFYYGDFIESHKKLRHIKFYPSMFCNMVTGNADKFYMDIRIDLMVMDKVYKGHENITDVESDTLLIISDYLNIIQYSERWQTFSKINGIPVVNKFIDRTGSEVSGWLCSFNLKVKKDYGICDLAMGTYDYGNQPSVGACAGVSIYINGIFEQLVPSGGSYDFTLSCQNTSLVFKTGQTSSLTSGDDGNRQDGNGVDWFTLDSNNGFGNTNRFTDTLGLQAYADGIMIDHSQRDLPNDRTLGFYVAGTGGKANWVTQINNCRNFNHPDYATGWFMGNRRIMENLMHEGSTYAYSYSPINWSITGPTNGGFWTNTYAGSNPNNAYVIRTDRQILHYSQNNTYYGMPVRWFTDAELNI